MYDVVIIGCGVSGASIAMELSKYHLSILILEKENDVCTATTKANSAIVHAGYDPEPGTLMAKLNVEGCRQMPSLCKELDVPYQQIGSLVLAFNEAEMKTLHQLRNRGIANGVPDQKILSYAQVKEMEPNISPQVKAALYAPTAGIVDPWTLGLGMAETAVKNDAELRLNSPVTAIKKEKDCWQLTTEEGDIQTKYVLNAAGVFSDAVHNMAAEPSFHINPCKGEYFLLDKVEGTRVNHVIFQCPNEDGKGILVTPTVYGNLLVGPTADKVENPNDCAVTTDGLNFVRTYAQKSIPGIQFRENIRNFAGVRANSSMHDFIMQESAPGFIDIAGMRSPGLASAPAVGSYVAELLKKSGLSLNKKETWNGSHEMRRFNERSIKEKNEIIKKEPAYGRIVCRCEMITEGEIAATFQSAIPPCSLDGIKRRTGAGMGRCQSGFCGPKVLELIAQSTGAPPETICLDKAGSFILTGETKKGGKRHA